MKVLKNIKKLFKFSTTSITVSSSDGSDDGSLDAPAYNKCRGRRIEFSEKDRDKPSCAVIVTISSGSSYDTVFSSVPQTSPDESVAVKVFQFNYEAIPEILRCFKGQRMRTATADVKKIIQEMLKCRNEVDPDSFVVNFECCSGCSCSGFEGESSRYVMDILAWIIEEKHIAMFADFSLKSLIADWSETALGPNPFVNLGDTDHPLAIRFSPEQLLESPNTQLQNLGRMCSDGSAYIDVMPQTIVFTLEPDNCTNNIHQLEVLTVVNGPAPSSHCEIPPLNKNGTTGTLGHAVLRYRTGACLLVSSGHWIELNRLDGISEEKLLETTLMTMGESEAWSLRNELSRAQDFDKYEVLQRGAKKALLSSAPCKYSKR